MQWKEDIRRKLAETASNFVYIGYRLKQIRDSGMYDGAADVFEFAQKEYGLGKSTVSRFIAINEKYSEGGNSLELKAEYKAFSSSKLAEMLTLPDAEVELITERTTIKEIRELKNFNQQEPEEQTAVEQQEPEWTPLEKCLIDFFGEKKEMLNAVMAHMEKDPPEYKEAADVMNPSGQASHKKGMCFLFLYDWSTGVKYKLLTLPEPVKMSWQELLDVVYKIYLHCDTGGVWEDFYKVVEKAVPPQSNQGIEGCCDVATDSAETEENETESEEIGTQSGETGTVEGGSDADRRENETDAEETGQDCAEEPENAGTGGEEYGRSDHGITEEELHGDISESSGRGTAECGVADLSAEGDQPAEEQEASEGVEESEAAAGLDAEEEDGRTGADSGNGAEGDGTEDEPGSGKYDEIIRRLINEVSEQADRIADRLKDWERKPLDEYKDIRNEANKLVRDLGELIRFVDMSEEDEEDAD